mgnify:CR=1 FL=1
MLKLKGAMLTLALAALAILGPVDGVRAQGCGPQNPNCIVTTMPPGDASNRAASDAFVQNAIQAAIGTFYTDLSGDCTATSLGVITCTKTNGTPFGTLAVQNANAVAITGGSITGMPSPTQNSDVATKRYVDLNEALNVVTNFGVDNTGATNTAPAFQNALNSAKSTGRCLYVPPGTYRIDTALTYASSVANTPGLCMVGSGMWSTIFETRAANNFMLTLDGYNGGPGFTFQYGMYLRGFSIQNTNSTTNAFGLRVTANWYSLIDSIRIDGMSGGGLQIYSALGTDSDLPNLIQVARSQFTNNFFGFRCLAPSGGNCGASLDFGPGNYVTANSQGVVLYAPLIISIHDNTIAFCTAGCLQLPYNNVYGRVVTVERNHFDTFGSGQYAITAPAVAGMRIADNQFRGSGAGVAFLGDASTIATSVHAENNEIQIGASVTPFTAYSINAGASNVVIENTYWPIFDAAGQTRFSLNPSASGIGIIDDGYFRGRNYTQTTTSFTPDLTKGTSQRAVTGSTLTVNAPTLGHLVGGERFNLCVINTSGGAVTPTFNAIYLTVAPSIASIKRACVDFVYDAGSTNWVQAAAWSPSL